MIEQVSYGNEKFSNRKKKTEIYKKNKNCFLTLYMRFLGNFLKTDTLKSSDVFRNFKTEVLAKHNEKILKYKHFSVTTVYSRVMNSSRIVCLQ